MAAFGCTLTVATGKIPSSQSNFNWVITEDNFPTAAIDGGASSILNGGGNLRCYTDDTKAVQLPIDIPVGGFVTGTTPSIQVWGLSPLLDVGSTVYVEADTIANSQPAFSGTFGRNAVWANDLRSYHLNESSGTVAIDSAGNTDGVYAGNLPTVGANFGQDFDGSNDFVGTTTGSIDFSAFTFSAKVNTDSLSSGAQQIYACDRSSTSSTRYWQWRIDATTGFVRIICWDSNSNIFINTTGSIALSTHTTYILCFSFDGSSYKTFINGVKDLDIASTSTIKPITSYSPVIGINNSTILSEDFNGEIGDLIVRDGAFKSDNQIEVEYNNQSDPATFFTTSAWVEQGASPINTLQYGSSPVLDVKYADGATLVDVVLQMNGTIVWQV